MEVVAYLVPLALMLGLLGLGAFLWSLKTGQYDDIDGAAWRAIIDDDAPVAAVDGPVDNRSNAAVRAKVRSAEH